MTLSFAKNYKGGYTVTVTDVDGHDDEWSVKRTLDGSWWTVNWWTVETNMERSRQIKFLYQIFKFWTHKIIIFENINNLIFLSKHSKKINLNYNILKIFFTIFKNYLNYFWDLFHIGAQE
jgi:hypothetical protein